MAANYVLLNSQQLTSSAASVTFSNIPQSGYTDLKIVASPRLTGNNGNAYTPITIQFNGSSANQTSRYVLQEGGTAYSYNYTTFYTWVDSSLATASTFGNFELYVPNYTSSSNKSASVDSVTENNATTVLLSLGALLWSNTAAITSITFTPSTTNFDTYSTFSLYGLAATGTTPVTAPKASGGNTVTTDGTYWYHTFLSSGYFKPIVGLTCNYYVLGGGATGSGGGSSGSGGGGGGGGSSYVTSASLSAQPYAVTIGAGGPDGGAGGTAGRVGNNSTFNSTTGGGGQQQSSFSVASPGGTGTTQNGGAGGIGYNSGNAQNGGAGYTNPLDSVARGGGGGGSTKSGTQGTGTNGGGNGVATGTGGSGSPNTGGGGGGSAQDNIGYGGAGGSGIVIIRYAV